MDMVLERVRAANPARAREADYEELFRAIVATPSDPRLARRRPRRVSGLRLVLVTLILFLILAGAATATYFALRTSDAITFSKGGSIVAVAGSGAGRPIWHCPGGANWCGEIAGVAWSPDGERLALSLWELGANSSYVGFHIIDPRTGTDRHFPPAATKQKFGCSVPSYLTWSPDGKLLAYTCRDALDSPREPGIIYTIWPDGTGRHLIPTGPFPAYSPTWSPDGKRLAFSTGEQPFLKRPMGGAIGYRSAVYVFGLDGSHARRVAWGALPDWSPDGKTIAYVTLGCGQAPDKGRIRLVTPAGHDATPPTAPCDGIGPAGHPVPAWSPDGRQIAVGTERGLYLMHADGTRLRKLQRGVFNSALLWGYLRPAWRPK
jgi:dipeptidyl aminopeptidase/acylaminoacyl peptidase